MNERTERIGRLVAIVGVLVGGYVHLKLYNDGYRDIPNYALGRSFLVNVVASGAAVALLAMWRSPLALLAGVGISVGTLGAFVKSRTGAGIFGFAEHGLQPSPEAVMALVAEIAAALVCTALLLRRVRRRPVPSVS
jgi:hypothetical protein